jgi:hypothetical protein
MHHIHPGEPDASTDYRRRDVNYTNSFATSQAAAYAVGSRPVCQLRFTGLFLGIERQRIHGGVGFHENPATGLCEPTQNRIGDDRVGEQLRPVGH